MKKVSKKLSPPRWVRYLTASVLLIIGCILIRTESTVDSTHLVGWLLVAGAAPLFAFVGDKEKEGKSLPEQHY